MQKSEKESSLKITSSSNKETIFVKTYLQEQAKVALICLHGIGEYHKAFLKFKKTVVEKNWPFDLYCPDMRGHGLSSGHRSYIPQFHDLSADIIKLIKQHLQNYEKVIVWGHEVGGLVALDIALGDQNQGECKLLDGLIVSNPLIQLKAKWVEDFAPYSSLITVGIPQLRIPLLFKGETLYSDPKFAKSFDNDPLFNHFLSLKLYSQIVEKAKDIVGKSYYFSHPALFLLSGNEQILDQEMTKIFIKSIPDNRIEMKEYKAAKHGIHNDKESKKVFEDIYNWVQGLD